MKNQTISISKILKKSNQLEIKCDPYNLDEALLLIKFYMNAVSCFLDKKQNKLASLYVVKALSVLEKLKENIYHNLLPGLNFIHFNQRMLHHLHHPLFAKIYYYDAYLSSMRKNKRGMEKSLDQALLILYHDKKKLTKKYRDLIYRVILLKQSLYPLNDENQINLIIRKKTLYKNDEHLYVCYKELGETYFNRMDYSLSKNAYVKMLYYAKKNSLRNADDIELLLKAIEHLKISLEKLNQQSKLSDLLSDLNFIKR